ncbi:MAG: hypothetical protein ACM3MF_10195 [Anaerolineae bacterium]
MTMRGEPKHIDQPADPDKEQPVPVTGTDEDEQNVRRQQGDMGWHKREPVGDSADDVDNPDDAGRVSGDRDPVEDSPDDSPDG